MIRFIAFLAAVLAMAATLPACPFCLAPTLTFSEQMAQADAAVLVQWKKAHIADKDNKTGSTEYEIVETVRDPLKTLKKGEAISIAGFRSGRPGDLSLILGSKSTKIDWGVPIDVTETVFNYIVQAPGPESTPEQRLTYFLKFLEYPDPAISSDAFSEFANADYRHIVPLASKFPREKLRKWVTLKELPEGRLGLYGLLLGLCGTQDDLPLMEQKILEPTPPQTIRLGIDGVMGGYLVLAGEKGLEFIERTRLSGAEVPYSETYSAMKALEFMWTYGEGKIPKDKLKRAMRMALARPELADLVISNLSRWKDWDSQEQILALFDQPEYDVPSLKRAVVRYFLACAKDMPKDAPELPSHVAVAKKRIEELRLRDPKVVREAERLPL